MAWLWKQGRPTLLAMVGMGVLGYKAFHRGHAPMQQRQAEVGVWDAATVHPPRTMPRPADAPPQTGFSAASASRSWPPASSRRFGSMIAWVGCAVGLLSAVCRLSVFSLFDCPAGFSAHPQPAGAHHSRPGHGTRESSPGTRYTERLVSEAMGVECRGSNPTLVMLSALKILNFQEP